MQDINSLASLKNAIHALEIEQAGKGMLLKEQFHKTYESLRPVNVLKSSIKEISSSPYLIENLLAAVIGLSSGYLSKILYVGRSGNSFRKLIGYVMQFGVSNLVNHNSEGIKKMGQLLFQKIFQKNETSTKSR